MNPSITTGIRRAAAPRQKPHMAAISRPPTQRRIPSGSPRLSMCRVRARRMAERLRTMQASSAAAPVPTTASGAWPVSAAAIALAEVVFPMPISPKPSRSQPCAAESAASSMPISRRGGHLGLGHCRPDAEVARALRHTAADQISGIRQRCCNSHIDYAQFNAPGAREGVDGRAAAQEVEDHLRRDLLRIGADSFRADTVIRREENDARAPGRQREVLANARATVGDLFDPAQAARRFR